MSRSRRFSTAGIVLRARPLGEADRIVTLFTQEYGKLDALAKGARRQRSALSGRLEFANACRFEMHRGRTLDIIVSAQILAVYWQRLLEPATYAAAQVVVELVDMFCEPELALPEVYALLSGALAAMTTCGDALALLTRFELRLLDALGFAPPTDACIACGAPLPAGAFLDAQAGGFLGPECHQAWQSLPSLDADDMANIAALAAPRGGAVRAALLARPRVAGAIDSLVDHHLGKPRKAGAHARAFVRGTA
ncbi:MAG: DNA repair protein RecO [Vulcanimicrobiaceae bacterium]